MASSANISGAAVFGFVPKSELSAGAEGSEPGNEIGPVVVGGSTGGGAGEDEKLGSGIYDGLGAGAILGLGVGTMLGLGLGEGI